MIQPNKPAIGGILALVFIFWLFNPFGSLSYSSINPVPHKTDTSAGQVPAPKVGWTTPISQDTTPPEEEHQALPHDALSDTEDDSFLIDHTDPVSTPPQTQTQTDEHPIPRLIREADLKFSSLLASQAKTVEQAAKTYRQKRGRHPPPGFDLWFKYARDNNAIVVEEFWDQVYHDLEPFWAIQPAVLRAQARQLGMAVIVKGGHAEVHTDWFWHVIWSKMIEEIAFMLPDMVVPMNSMDEPRMMVPWANISEYVSIAAGNKKLHEASSVRRKIQGWGEQLQPPEPELPAVEWHVVPPYSFARDACPPEAPIRGDYKLYNGGLVPLESGSSKNWMHSHRFVENSTLWSDTCQDPAIAAYHGALISPLSGSTSTVLQPLFGGSKFAANNDILLPAPMYWNGEERFEQDDVTPWAEKSSTVIWRGTATGGRHNALNWPHFHRHRFVALANGTRYEQTTEHDRVYTPAHRQAAIDPLQKPVQQNLEAWLNKRNNVAFTDLFCDVPQPVWGTCYYLDPEYSVAPGLTLAEQYRNKYLPDIDGNSFSGRYRSFLHSNSLPIKATLYREWHDSRLIAWKHFVPMNNRFSDYYSILEYFVGCEKDICGADVIEGHDKDAERIATAGADWAKKALRKVDMQIYVARLLLEFGRVTDDHRETVGWVEDLSGSVREDADEQEEQVEQLDR